MAFAGPPAALYHHPSRPLARPVVWVLAALLAAGCARMPPDPALKRSQPRPDPPAPELQAADLPPADSRTLRIDLDNQGFHYFEDGRLVRSGPVSAGSAEHPTPTGEYRVQSKEEDKVSYSYTNAFDMPTPMPYSLQFSGPYFIHEGWLPGYPDSHGCVRLHYEDARFLFERMQRGDAVLIQGSDDDAGRPRQSAVGGARQPRGDWLGLGDPRRHWQRPAGPDAPTRRRW